MTTHNGHTRTSTVATAWALPKEEVLSATQSSADGISEKEAQNRRSVFGENTFTKKETVTVFEIFTNQFKSPLIFILIAASILTALLREWIDTAVILLAVFVNTGLGFFQEYRAEQTLEKLTQYIKERTRVIRAGIEEEVDARTLVPGDIISLTYGSRIPADARLLSVNNLMVDEAILTGESLPIRKTIEVLPEGTGLSDRTNMIFAGTLITEGYATAVVCEIGSLTELGRIAELVSETKRPDTPLQASLKRFSWVVFFVALILITGIFALGISRGQTIIEMALLSSAVFVGAVPEALPIALTVILAAGLSRLAKRNGVMRSLSAAETLGSATIVMTDKTGTLTEARMRLVGVATRANILAKNSDTELKETISDGQQEILLSSLANIDVVEEKGEEGGAPHFLGKPLEANIALAAYNHGIRLSSMKKELVIPFNSTNKFSVSRSSSLGKIIVMGAPDILLARSNSTASQKEEIEEYIERVSSEGRRLVGVARFTQDQYNAFSAGSIAVSDVKNIELLGVLVLHDPVRAEVPEAIRTIEAHGAEVVMVTGDLKGTALAVARDIGWSVDESAVLSGVELRQLSDEELLATLPRIRIFARVTPEDKLRIGVLYKKLGKVVAMTGDGVNDAPSLKAVDIGIALGSGSDVAKSAAALVLLDDNFKTIVAAIEEGRRILANIRKVFVYLMSNSLDEVILVGGSLLFGLALPLSALQIIWVNFFTGSLPALAFAFDSDYDSTSVGRHVSRSIFNKEVVWLTAGVGILTSVALFVLYATLLHNGFALEQAQTLLFVCFASYILAVSFSFRSLHNPLFSYPVFANKYLNISILIATGLLVATMAIPWMRDIFKLGILPKEAIWIIPLWLVANILLVEIAKFVFRIKTRKKV